MESTNLGSVRRWLFDCPATGDQPFGVDFLGSDPNKFALVSIASVFNTRENIMGEIRPARQQRENMAIDYRAAYGSQAETNLRNLALFHALHNWIMTQNNIGNFPQWHGGTVKSIVPTITPTIMDRLDASARYRIQICVTYETN